MAMQIAYAFATGNVTLDRKPTQKGKVLYFALEDSPRRIKSRLSMQGANPQAEGITFITQWETLDKGGLALLHSKITTEYPNLVVIDTFGRFIGNADHQDIGEMTTVVGNLQRMAQIHDITILMLDHHRKAFQNEQSPIDDIIGSTAKAAVADAALGLFREQGRHEAILKVTGRDIEENEFALSWDAKRCTWDMLGLASEVRKDSVRAEILDAIRTLRETGELATTASIAAHLGKDKGNVSKELGELVGLGKVIKGEKVGKNQPYSLVND
jgi:RecA-family ATPase